MKKSICVLTALVMLLCVSLASAEARPALTFADIADLEWTFSSGVGGWYTCVWIHEDGTFTGEFHDSEMGETGEGYPYGTVYGCLFHGKMTLGEQADETAWRVHVDELALDEGQAPEVIEDEMRFVTTDPYGLRADSDLLLYLPGTPVELISEELRAWLHLYEYGEDVTELPYYGLCDPQEQTGFVGDTPYVVYEEIVDAWRSDDEEGDGYILLVIGSDGTGTMTHQPEETGVPLTWCAEDEGWTVCIGSSESKAALRYDAETDRLTLIEVNDNGEEKRTVFERDWWDAAEVLPTEE